MVADALSRFDHLPLVLSRDPFVIAGARGDGLEDLNRRLQDFAVSAGLEAIYLLNREGLTVASSNFDAPKTVSGPELRVSGLFSGRAGGPHGSVLCHRGHPPSGPGSFCGRAGHNGWRDRGVLAIKHDLQELADLWTLGPEQVLVSNRDGVVVLASDPAWRYTTLAPLSPMCGSGLRPRGSLAGSLWGRLIGSIR